MKFKFRNLENKIQVFAEFYLIYISKLDALQTFVCGRDG